jgi:methylthioribulose-1-phosphate dehydratase
MLHMALTRDPQVNAVLHTHSIWATLLSDLYHDQGMLQIEGYEMLKGLHGVTTHASPIALKIVENTQDIPQLAAQLVQWRRAGDPLVAHGLLLRRHGLYTWGHDLDEAVRHVEILEFLFEVLGRRLSLVPHATAAW